MTPGREIQIAIDGIGTPANRLEYTRLFCVQRGAMNLKTAVRFFQDESRPAPENARSQRHGSALRCDLQAYFAAEQDKLRE